MPCSWSIAHPSLLSSPFENAAFHSTIEAGLLRSEQPMKLASPRTGPSHWSLASLESLTDLKPLLS
jgi:hypothetical protein